jgi:hypothetical protein
VIGSGQSELGARWKVKAYRLDGRIGLQIAIRRPGVLGSRGGLPTTPECGEIGWGGYHGDIEESYFSGPVTGEVDSVRAWFRSTEERRLAGEVNLVRMSPREAEIVGSDQRLGVFVAVAPVDVNDFRRVHAIAVDASGQPFPGYTWFAHDSFGCGERR